MQNIIKRASFVVRPTCYNTLPLSTNKMHYSRPALSPSSQRWVQRQNSDIYVKKARKEGYRSRAAYKLLEINYKLNKFLRNNKVVVDLGCAPGSWIQVTREQMKKGGLIVGVDLLPLHPFPKRSPNDKVTIKLIKGDFTTPETQAKIIEALEGKEVSAVYSDMAPNSTGNKQLDHGKIMQLIRQAFSFAQNHLADGGAFVCKVYQGKEEPEFRKEVDRFFNDVYIVKPKSSRGESNEVYYCCGGFKKHLMEQK